MKTENKKTTKIKQLILDTNSAFSWANKLFKDMQKILIEDFKINELDEDVQVEISCIFDYYIKRGQLDTENLNYLLEDIFRKGKWFKK